MLKERDIDILTNLSDYMPWVKLNLDDIEPLEKALDKCARLGSGGFYYKGEFWDWRMGNMPLIILKR